MGKGKKGNIKVAGLVVLFCLVAGSIAFAWLMSSASAQESNRLSYNLVERSAVILMEKDLEWTPGYWYDAYNMLLRKLGHFTEYLLIGLFSSLLFFTLFERMLQNFRHKFPWRPVSLKLFLLGIFGLALSFGVSFGASFLDEFYWQRISGRHPRWFDVGLDMTGACLGMVLCLFIFSIGRWAGSSAQSGGDRKEIGTR